MDRQVAGTVAAKADWLDAWLTSRRQFFEAVVENCGRRTRGGSPGKPSIYLADLRDASLAAAGDQYVDEYCTLLGRLEESVRRSANQAVIEPVLFCDRAVGDRGSLHLAPTHPISVALLTTLQRGILQQEWTNLADRGHIEWLVNRPILGGILPWVPWRGQVLASSRRAPLLWQLFGTPGGVAVDTDSELDAVVGSKVKRLLELCPYLNSSGQVVCMNVDVGPGQGEYLLRAMEALSGDSSIRCRFDVGVVSTNDEPALTALFKGRATEANVQRRNLLLGRVQVAKLGTVGEREAHLVFRTTGPQAEATPFAGISRQSPLVRDSGFAAGLLEEPVRFAEMEANEVRYTRYVSSSGENYGERAEGLWGGRSRERYATVVSLARRLSLGLLAGVVEDTVPSRRLRQVARADEAAEYGRAFISIHCDPDQGPEFFVGQRASRAGIYLVECSDRGDPELPGRDIVSVTSRIAPFTASLRTALGALPSGVRQRVDANVTKGLLRDINLVRGTKVFDFMRAAAKHAETHTGFMDGLDNILAMRWLLSAEALTRDDTFPVVIALRDLTGRSPIFKSLEGGTRCDDILVLYLPLREQEVPRISYRLVEVKFGARRQQWEKAGRQLAETSKRLREIIPSEAFATDGRPSCLIVARDLAWSIHEVMERYRSFGVLQDDEGIERALGLKQLFRKMNHGEVEFQPWEGNGVGGKVEPPVGTALMLDHTIPGDQVIVELDRGTEYVTVPLGRLEALLVTPAPLMRVSAVSAAPPQAAPSAPQPVPAAPPEPVPTAPPQLVPAAPPRVVSPAPSVANTRQGEAPGQQGAAADPVFARIDQAFDGFIGNQGAVRRIKQALRLPARCGKLRTRLGHHFCSTTMVENLLRLCLFSSMKYTAFPDLHRTHS